MSYFSQQQAQAVLNFDASFFNFDSFEDSMEEGAAMPIGGGGFEHDMIDEFMLAQREVDETFGGRAPPGAGAASSSAASSSAVRVERSSGGSVGRGCCVVQEGGEM